MPNLKPYQGDTLETKLLTYFDMLAKAAEYRAHNWELDVTLAAIEAKTTPTRHDIDRLLSEHSFHRNLLVDQATGERQVLADFEYVQLVPSQ